MKQLTEHVKQLFYFQNQEKAKPVLILTKPISLYVNQNTKYIVRQNKQKRNIENMSISSIEHNSKFETEFSDKNLKFLQDKDSKNSQSSESKKYSEIDSSHLENFNFIKELDKELAKKPKINKRDLSYDKKIFDIYEPEYSSSIEQNKSSNSVVKEPLTSFQFIKKIDNSKKKSTAVKNTKKKQITNNKVSQRKKQSVVSVNKPKKKNLSTNLQNIQRNYSNDKSIKQLVQVSSKKKFHSNSLQNFNMRDKYFVSGNQNKPFNFENSIYNNHFKTQMITLKKKLQKQDYNKKIY